MTYQLNSNIKLIIDHQGDEFDNQYWFYPLELNDVIDNGTPVIIASTGKSLDTATSTTSITFEVEENNFEKYILYNNGTKYEEGSNFKDIYSFVVPVNEGNTTWVLEIIDTLGHIANASTWVEGLVNDNTSLSVPVNGQTVFLTLSPMLMISIISLKRKVKSNN